jgi:RNA polymerase sigma-70 factor (ECF subfamily)
LRSKHIQDDIYGAHRRALIAYAERISGDRAEAEDVVQDAWLQLRKVLDREPLREPVPYLYRVVRNLAIDSRRRASRRAQHITENAADALAELADEAPSPEVVIGARAELQCVERALATLPERQRIAIEMYRLGGFKLREIADRLNISVSLAHLLIAKGLAECHRLCRLDDAAGGE